MLSSSLRVSRMDRTRNEQIMRDSSGGDGLDLCWGETPGTLDKRMLEMELTGSKSRGRSQRSFWEVGDSRRRGRWPAVETTVENCQNLQGLHFQHFLLIHYTVCKWFHLSLPSLANATIRLHKVKVETIPKRLHQGPISTANKRSPPWAFSPTVCLSQTLQLKGDTK